MIGLTMFLEDKALCDSAETDISRTWSATLTVRIAPDGTGVGKLGQKRRRERSSALEDKARAIFLT